MSERAWKIAGCCVSIVWTPWQCRCIWPLLVACAELVHNGTSNFREENLRPCIAECHHISKGVRCQAWDDVDKARPGWELR
jgi:hypothetical protein